MKNFFWRKKKTEEEEDNEYEEEIKQIVTEGHEQGAILADEAQMISNIFEFGDKEARDIMCFRKKIVGIEKETSVEDALRFMLDQNYSRFPLFEEDLDHVIGILHIKDVMRAFFQNPSVDLTEIASDPIYVHETKDINTLFREMQSKKTHMVIVIDEYGQTEGLLTMEDILETIVGNILDEYDVEEREIIRLGQSDNYMVQGMTRLDELEDILHIEFHEEEIETLSGFMVNLAGKLPMDDSKVQVEYEGYSFTSIEIKNHVIRLVKISKLNKQQNESAE